MVGRMSRPAPKIQLSAEEKETLLRWMRSTKTERRMVGACQSNSFGFHRSERQGDRNKDGDPDSAREQVAATVAHSGLKIRQNSRFGNRMTGWTIIETVH